MNIKKAILETILEFMYKHKIKPGRARLSLLLDIEILKIESRG